MDWNLRPARDLGLRRGERLRSPAREVGLVNLATHWLWRQSVLTYLRGVHRFAVTGRENLPSAPPYVLVANHGSHLDALALLAALPGSLAHRVFALAAGDTFFTTRAGSAFAAYALNALPVWRGRTRTGDLLDLRRRMTEDHLAFILFPEGTRSRDGTMGRFKPGLGALVAGSTVPVVPCYLDGAHAAWPPQRRLPRPGTVRIRIGPPLLFQDSAGDKAAWTDIAARCEAAVRALGP